MIINATGEPGGIPILPGSYKVVVQYRSNKDSSTVTVKQDPRLEYPIAQLKEKQEAYNSYLEKVRNVKSAFDKLKEAKKTITGVNDALASSTDTAKTRISKMGKELEKKIQDLMDIYLTPEDFKGIDRSDRLVGSLQRTASYIAGSDAAPTFNEMCIRDRDSAVHREVIDQLLPFLCTDIENYSGLPDDQKTIFLLSIPEFKKEPELDFSSLAYDCYHTIRLIKEIQQLSGELACHRYITVSYTHLWSTKRILI